MSEKDRKELEKDFFEARDNYAELYKKEDDLRRKLRESVEGKAWYGINEMFQMSGIHNHWRTKYKSFEDYMEAERQVFEAMESTDRYKEWLDVFQKEQEARKLFENAKMKYKLSDD